MLRQIDSFVLVCTQRGPRARLVEIAGGHAPWLKSADEIALQSDWLAGHWGDS